MKIGTLLILAVVGVAGYFIYQNIKGQTAASNASNNANNNSNPLSNLGNTLGSLENDLTGTGGNGISGLTNPTGASDEWNNAGLNELPGDDNASSSDPYDG